MTSIRSATPEDAARIAHVQVETWRSAYRGIVPDAYLASLDVGLRAERWLDLLNSPESILLVGASDETVVGFATGGPIREPVQACDAELYAIYVLPQFQRNILGSCLLIELARRLHAAGFRSMGVWLFQANIAAARFYERSGATLAASREREYAGVLLPLIAYRWPDLGSLCGRSPRGI